MASFVLLQDVSAIDVIGDCACGVICLVLVVAACLFVCRRNAAPLRIEQNNSSRIDLGLKLICKRNVFNNNSDRPLVIIREIFVAIFQH